MKRVQTRSRLEWLLVAPWRLVLFVAVALALPIIVLNESSVRLAETRISAETRAAGIRGAEAGASVINSWVRSLRARIAAAAEVPDLKAATQAKDVVRIQESLLTEIGRVLSSEADIVGLAIVDPSGQVIWGRSGAGTGLAVAADLSAVDHFRAAVETATRSGSTSPGAVYVSDVTPGLPARAVTEVEPTHPTGDRIVASVPIRFGLGSFVGVLIAETDRREIGRLLIPQATELLDLYLIDRQGRSITRAGDPGDPPRDLASSQVVRVALNGGSRVEQGLDPARGTKVTLATARVPETGWVVLSAWTPRPADVEAASALQQQRLAGSAFAVLLVLASALVGATAARSIRRRNALAESLEQQTAIGEILRGIASGPVGEGSILQTIAAATLRYCAAEDAVVALLQDGEVRPVAHAGSIPLPNWPGAWSHSKVIEPTDEIAESSNRARAVAVLKVNERTVGALIIQRIRPNRFTQKEVELLRTFADQAVIAIEHTRLFNEIQDKSRQLEAASRNKSEFLANMSHELRTPLNAIIGFSDVMLEGMAGQLDKRAREYADDIRSSGQHLLSLINDVLDLSKVEAGRMELELGEVPLDQAVDEALALVRERAARHGITLASDVPPDLPLITADARKVKQVLVNLLSNAVKFTPDGGWVGVSVKLVGEEVAIAVRDTGVGIPPDDQARIFEEFRQSRRLEGRSAEGTGLGLTLTKRFVELHGGRIAVSSEVGKGSTFTVHLPLRQPTAAEAPVAS